MKVNVWQDTSRANWVDYVLSWLSSVFAVFSCGQAVNMNLVSIVGIGLVTLGMAFSYFMRIRFEFTKFAKIDGVLYSLAAWGAVLTARSINVAIFPEDTFPPELLPSAWLFWMTIFGTFFCWRDGTIIFQSIPALAMFGFVGCYDTFRFVVFFFFLFLLCFATLFARAHGRDMQGRAVESGFFNLGQAHHLTPSEQSTSLRNGPWRWAAGAEWALGSALIIVFLSLIGAPVIQATAKPLSGIVSVRPPRLRQNTPPVRATNVPTTAVVGNGPVSLSDTPVFEVTGDVPDYLRVATYGWWNGRQWATVETDEKFLINRHTGKQIGTEDSNQADEFRYPNKKPGQYPDDYRSKVANIRALVPTREVLLAGNNPNFQSNKAQDTRTSNVTMVSMDKYEAKLNYDVIPEPKSSSNAPEVIDSTLAQYIEQKSAIGQIRSFVLNATKDLKSDYDKAVAVKNAIGAAIKYNTRVDATPDGKDASDYALFEKHEGYCDVFATSMVRAARVLKIPSRYTIGYLPDTKNRNSQGTQMILESDRHAWAELYFDKIGWVVFDATEGADVVPGGGRHDNKPTDSTAVLKLVGNILNGLIVLAAIVGVVLFFRIRNLPKTGSMIRSELDTEYLKFIGAIWKTTGHRRLLSETSSEYLKRVSPDIGPLKSEADEISFQFTNLMFGPDELQAADVESIRQSVQHFRDQLIRFQKGQPLTPLEG